MQSLTQPLVRRAATFASSWSCRLVSTTRWTSSYPQTDDDLPTRTPDSPGQPLEFRGGRLVQAHITCRSTKKVLLGKWKSGPFAGRVSGLIGQTEEGETPEQAASRISYGLAGLTVAPTEFERRALFGFVEAEMSNPAAKTYGSIYQELQLVCNRESNCGLEPTETDMFSPLGWVSFEDIPYSDMPADDEIWYPKVLHVCSPSYGGRFWFEGQKLVDSKLWEIDREQLYDITADQDPLTAGKPSLNASL